MTAAGKGSDSKSDQVLDQLRRRIVDALDLVPTIDWNVDELRLMAEVVETVVSAREEQHRTAGNVVSITSRKGAMTR